MAKPVKKGKSVRKGKSVKRRRQTAESSAGSPGTGMEAKSRRGHITAARRKRKIVLLVAAVLVPAAGLVSWLVFVKKYNLKNLASKEGRQEARSLVEDGYKQALDTGKRYYDKYGPELAAMAKKWQQELDDKLKSYDDVLAEKQKRAQEEQKLKMYEDEQLRSEEARRNRRNAAKNTGVENVPRVPGVMTENVMKTVITDKRLGESDYNAPDIEKSDAYRTVDISDEKLKELKKTSESEQKVKIFRFKDVSEYSTGRRKYSEALEKFNRAQRGITKVEPAAGKRRGEQLGSLRKEFVEARDAFDKAGRLFEIVERKALEGGAAGAQMSHLGELLDAYARSRNACVEQIVLIDRAERDNKKNLDMIAESKSAPTSSAASSHSKPETVSSEMKQDSRASRNPIFRDSDYKKGYKHYRSGAEFYRETMAGPPSKRDRGYEKTMKELEKSDEYWTKVMEKYGDNPKYAKNYPEFDEQFSQLAFLLYACRKHHALNIGLH